MNKLCFNLALNSNIINKRIDMEKNLKNIIVSQKETESDR